jgi:O-antigen ligase
VSALNARCVYLGNFEYKYFACLNWLPHSYDARLTWQAFWNYLALALDFWAVRDWLMTGERLDRAQIDSRSMAGSGSGWVIPCRLSLLLWVLSLNGAILAAEGILQRALGTGKLLWLVEPHINKTAEAQFGPYAYRSNAAQYFLLVWPVVLGFWQLLRDKRPEGRQLRMHNYLLPCVLIMAIVPLMSLSRAGAILGVAAMIAAAIALMGGGRRPNKRMLAVSALLGLAALLGVYLEWGHLAKRFDSSTLDHSRLEIWRNTWEAFTHSPVFGTGAGTFSSVYDFYWSGKDQGMAQAHNDWLELLLTFGGAGSVLVLAAGLVLVLAHRSGRIHLGKAFPKFICIALGSCLLYATVDFPLTVYSILFLFIVECAVLSCVSSKR